MNLQQNIFPLNYVMKLLWEMNLFGFIPQICMYFVYSCTIRNTVHLIEVWLAQICSVAEWNFFYSSLSCSVLLLAHWYSFFPLSGLSIFGTIQFTLHKFGWSKFDCSYVYFWMYHCVGESWTWLPVQSANSEVSTINQDQDSSIKTYI